MTDNNHNGGPPLDRDVPDMTYVKFYPGDFLNGTAHMSLEMRGAYITALAVMYDRMGGFPYDEAQGGVLLRVDKRVYRRVRDFLIADGKFYRDGDMIRNARVEKEIESYVCEYIRRSNAAKKREAQRREKETSAELRPNLSPTSAELPPNLARKSEESSQNLTQKTQQKQPTNDHSGTTYQKPEARSQKPEAINKRSRESKDSLALFAPREVSDIVRVFQTYNDLAQRVGLPAASVLTKARKASIKERLKEHGGYPAWERVLSMIERSAYLQGGGSRGWKPSFDWLMRPTNFTKVYEGTYGNGAHRQTSQQSETYVERMRRLMGVDDAQTVDDVREIEIIPPGGRL